MWHGIPTAPTCSSSPLNVLQGLLQLLGQTWGGRVMQGGGAPEHPSDTQADGVNTRLMRGVQSLRNPSEAPPHRIRCMWQEVCWTLFKPLWRQLGSASNTQRMQPQFTRGPPLSTHLGVQPPAPGGSHSPAPAAQQCWQQQRSARQPQQCCRAPGCWHQPPGCGPGRP